MAAFSSSSIMLHKDDLRNKPGFQWPNNNGCDDSEPEKNHPLNPGDLIDRFGDDNGYYFGNAGDYFIYRSLPYFGEFDETDKEKMKNMKKEYENYYKYNKKLYNQYRVLKNFDVSMCKIAGAYGYSGDAVQYRTPQTAKELLENGFIERMPKSSYLLPQFMHPDSTSSGGRTRRRRTKRRYCRRKTHYRRKLTTTG